MNAVMNIRVPYNTENVLSSCGTAGLSRWIPLYGIVGTGTEYE
jgi:hypothetical protein